MFMIVSYPWPVASVLVQHPGTRRQAQGYDPQDQDQPATEPDQRRILTAPKGSTSTAMAAKPKAACTDLCTRPQPRRKDNAACDSATFSRNRRFSYKPLSCSTRVSARCGWRSGCWSASSRPPDDGGAGALGVKRPWRPKAPGGQCADCPAYAPAGGPHQLQFKGRTMRTVAVAVAST